MSTTPTRYPGQCTHRWAPNRASRTGAEACVVPDCGATCTRGRDGLIEVYDAGIRETVEVAARQKLHDALDDLMDVNEAAA